MLDNYLSTVLITLTVSAKTLFCGRLDWRKDGRLRHNNTLYLLLQPNVILVFKLCCLTPKNYQMP